MLGKVAHFVFHSRSHSDITGEKVLVVMKTGFNPAFSKLI